MKRRPLVATAGFLSLAATLLSALPLSAQPATRTRETYFAGDAAAPELVNSYLREHPGEAIEIITFRQTGREPVQIFHAFAVPARSAQGVCRFLSTQIFPHTADDGKTTWDSTPTRQGERVEAPLAMGVLAPAPCPRQSDAAYAALGTGVTDADFQKLSDFWKEVSQSPQKFDAASPLLPLLISPRAAERFANFRTSVQTPTAEPLRLRAVFRSGGNSFDLAFSSTATDPPSFFLSVSQSEAGFQMMNFQTRF
jgi:hypothetical protein